MSFLIITALVLICCVLPQHTLSPEMEAELVKYVLEMESKFFGLTPQDLRSLAYQLAERNNLKHRFNKEKQMAGRDWLNGFLSRHPELSIRQPEATSAARARGFNRVVVGQFFDFLESVMDEHKFSPQDIYNVDESGFTNVQGHMSKIIAQKGKKQVGALTAAERGTTVTVEICMSVTGSYIPPMFIFPRMRMKPELRDDLPPGSLPKCHPTGWMQMDLFTEWFKHFIRNSGASKVHPVLLILDGHATHTRNVDVIDLARENGITLLCTPPTRRTDCNRWMSVL